MPRQPGGLGRPSIVGLANMEYMRTVCAQCHVARVHAQGLCGWGGWGVMGHMRKGRAANPLAALQNAAERRQVSVGCASMPLLRANVAAHTCAGVLAIVRTGTAGAASCCQQVRSAATVAAAAQVAASSSNGSMNAETWPGSLLPSPRSLLQQHHSASRNHSERHSSEDMRLRLCPLAHKHLVQESNTKHDCSQFPHSVPATESGSKQAVQRQPWWHATSLVFQDECTGILLHRPGTPFHEFSERVHCGLRITCFGTFTLQEAFMAQEQHEGFIQGPCGLNFLAFWGAVGMCECVVAERL